MRLNSLGAWSAYAAAAAEKDDLTVGGLNVARILPWAVTGSLLAIALTAMAIWTRNIGIQEDWGMVGPWLRQEPDLLGWLWSQNNEHRLPVGRLIYLGLLRATDDFRSGMIASQLLLAALSLLLAHAASTARGGKPLLSDVLFPLALLHLGHWENLLWGWQIQFVSSTFLCGVLLAVVIWSPRPRLAGAIAAATAMTLLPWTGANGIAVATGMIPWGVLAAFLAGREVGADSRVRGVLLAGILLSLAATATYFIGYVSPPWSPPMANADQFSRAAQAYFAMATGTWSRVADGTIAAFVLLTLAVAGFFALAAFRRFQFRDARSFGLASFIGVNVLLGFLIAASRGALPYQMPARYALFSVLPFLAAIVALQLYGPARLARTFSLLVALGFFVALPLNARAGFQWRDWYVEVTQNFEADMAAHLPPAEIAARNTESLLHSCDGCLLREMRRLRDRDIAPFSRLARDEPAAALPARYGR